MCICINCYHIKSCTIYRIVLIQHNQEIQEKQTLIFTPNYILIDINIHQNIYNIKLEWDLVECSSFVEQPGCWLT